MAAPNLYCGRMTADGPCPQPTPCPDHPPVFMESVQAEDRTQRPPVTPEVVTIEGAIWDEADREQAEGRLHRYELIDLETRMVTMSLAVLGELMDLAAQVEHFHEHMDEEAKERALEQHWEILSGLGVNDREATELDDTVAVAGDQWRKR